MKLYAPEAALDLRILCSSIRVSLFGLPRILGGSGVGKFVKIPLALVVDSAMA